MNEDLIYLKRNGERLIILWDAVGDTWDVIWTYDGHARTRAVQASLLPDALRDLVLNHQSNGITTRDVRFATLPNETRPG